MGTGRGWGEMTQEFLTGVRSIVERLLTELGFHLDEYDDGVERRRAPGFVLSFFAPVTARCKFTTLPEAARLIA